MSERKPKCGEAHYAQVAYDFQCEVAAIRDSGAWTEDQKTAAFQTLLFLAERMARNFQIDNPEVFHRIAFMVACGLE